MSETEYLWYSILFCTLCICAHIFNWWKHGRIGDERHGKANSHMQHEWLCVFFFVIKVSASIGWLMYLPQWVINCFITIVRQTTDVYGDKFWQPCAPKGEVKLTSFMSVRDGNIAEPSFSRVCPAHLLQSADITVYSFCYTPAHLLSLCIFAPSTTQVSTCRLCFSWTKDTSPPLSAAQQAIQGLRWPKINYIFCCFYNSILKFPTRLNDYSCEIYCTCEKFLCSGFFLWSALWNWPFLSPQDFWVAWEATFTQVPANE